MSDEQTISKYDRLRGNLHDVALFTRPSTIKNVQNITGKTETFVVETCRHEELGDFIFVECMDEVGLTRVALPPRVANAIAAQRDSLTAKRRSTAAKRVAAERKNSVSSLALCERKKLSNKTAIARGGS